MFDGKTTVGWKGAFTAAFPAKGWKVVNGLLMVEPSGCADVAGNRVYNKSHAASSQISVDVSGLANGFYVVRVGEELSQMVIAK